LKQRVFIAALAALMASQSAQAETGPSLASGARIAAERCGRCHATDLEGQSSNPLSPRFRDLGAHYPFDGLRDALAQNMIIGHPQLMPVVSLTPREIDDLIAYLKRLQRPATPERGAERPLG
jgi:cytochrome c553